MRACVAVCSSECMAGAWSVLEILGANDDPLDVCGLSYRWRVLKILGANDDPLGVLGFVVSPPPI